MARKRELPITEDLDFHYLLELMPPLRDVPDFAWLPELFSIIGHEKLITLCKFAGGEKIQIPTLDELNSSISALQWFYDVEIKRCTDSSVIPRDIYPMYLKICEVYNARNS